MTKFPNYICKSWQYRLWITFGIFAVLFSAVATLANPVALIFTIGFSVMLARLFRMRSQWRKAASASLVEVPHCPHCGSNL